MGGRRTNFMKGSVMCDVSRGGEKASFGEAFFWDGVAVFYLYNLGRSFAFCSSFLILIVVAAF